MDATDPFSRQTLCNLGDFEIPRKFISFSSISGQNSGILTVCNKDEGTVKIIDPHQQNLVALLQKRATYAAFNDTKDTLALYGTVSSLI